jgi:hypothetical protein
MATQAEIRQRVYDYLFGAFPTEAPFVTRLATSYASGATSVTVLDDEQWEVNDVLENTETSEQFMVVAKPGADVLTVIPSWAGTTAAASVGTDDVLYKNPRFTVKKVDDAITSAIKMLELWGVHAFAQGTITRVNPQDFYELAETDIIPQLGVLRLYEVIEQTELPSTLPFRYQFHYGAGPAEYSTGTGLFVQDWGQTANGEAVYFVYAQRLTMGTLSERQEELVVLGATVILMGGTIIPATHDPGKRTDRTTPPGQTSRDVRHFQGRFISETRMEAAQLAVERQHMLHETPLYSRARRWVS